MPLATLTASITSTAATHGLLAVFALMLWTRSFPPQASDGVRGRRRRRRVRRVRLTLVGHAFGAGVAGHLAAALAGDGATSRC